ncbi:MAG: radical SAM protein, partial [Lachnospiraceae bacterium]|nr:radical SAM protein [Lachnospiraceae bacterium]
MEIAVGDVLLTINNQELKDVFDYHFYMNDEYIVVLLRKPNGEEWELEIEKEYEED